MNPAPRTNRVRLVFAARPVAQFITLEYGFALERHSGPIIGPRGCPRIP